MFYDIVKSFPDGFDIIIGDVMGKGVLAALVGAGMKQSFLKALAERSNTSQGLPPPDIVTQRVSKWMTPGLMDLESFVTIVFARIDQNMKTMSFTDCGHTPVLQYLAFGKKIVMHKGPNLPIGVQAEEIIQETTFNIYPGDLLFFMSDGVIETTSPEGELYGLDRFSEFVESHQHLTADEIIYGLEKELDSFKGKLENQDDITCICIKLPVS